MQRKPGLADAFVNLNKAVMKNDSEITSEFKRLIAFVSSNATGCRYCQAHTIRAAERYGSSKERMLEIWNFEDRYNPNVHIKRGYIDVSDNVVFLYHRDCLKLFGYKGGHYQKGWWETKKQNEAVWFPKLYPNKQWRNLISNDRTVITQELVIGGKKMKNTTPTTNDKRIVFAHYKNVLGQTVYKFYGVFEPDWNKTNDYKQVFKRVPNGNKIYLDY